MLRIRFRMKSEKRDTNPEPHQSKKQNPDPLQCDADPDSVTPQFLMGTYSEMSNATLLINQTKYMLFISPFLLLPHLLPTKQYQDRYRLAGTSVPREKQYFISVILLRMCIKTASGEFIVSQKNGGFTAEALDADSATRWEYQTASGAGSSGFPSRGGREYQQLADLAARWEEMGVPVQFVAFKSDISLGFVQVVCGFAARWKCQRWFLLLQNFNSFCRLKQRNFFSFKCQGSQGFQFYRTSCFLTGSVLQLRFWILCIIPFFPPLT